jgi:transcriptional regulator with XRE-family HTH domain
MNTERLLILGNRLKLIRAESRLTQREFAEQFNMPPTTYSGYESGRHEPTIDFLIAIAEKYNLSLDYVVGRTMAKEGIGQEEFNQEMENEVIAPLMKEGMTRDEAIETFAQSMEEQIEELKVQIAEFRKMKNSP